MENEQRPRKVRKVNSIVQDYVEAYSGFLSACLTLDEEATGLFYDWVQRPRRVEKVEFWASKTHQFPRVYFFYEKGCSTNDFDNEAWGFNTKDFSLLDTLRLHSSEYIVDIVETRVSKTYDGDDFEEYHLLNMELGISSGRRFKVVFHTEAFSVQSSRILQAADGHMIVDFDSFWAPKGEKSEDITLGTHFMQFGGECVFHVAGELFSHGIVQVPIDGNFYRLPDLVLAGEGDLSQLKDVRNHFKSGNVAHVLCHIGGDRAAAALMKLVEAGLGTLLEACDDWGKSPAFYAITSLSSSTSCLETVLRFSKAAINWDLSEGTLSYGFNLAHLAAHEGKNDCLDVLSQHEGARHLFSVQCKYRSWTPAHYAVGIQQGSCYTDPNLIRDLDHEEVHDRLRCLQVLHEALSEYLTPLLKFHQVMPDAQSFSSSLMRAQANARDAAHLCVKDRYGWTAAHYATKKEFADYLLEIGGLVKLHQDVLENVDMLMQDKTFKYKPEIWPDVLSILMSSPKYLPLPVRQRWLSVAMAQSIPADEEGLVLDVADWSSPLLGACEALGVDERTGTLSSARPALLVTVRNAASDAAAGDGLRREWLNRVARQLLEPDHGLFEQDPGQRTLVLNKHSGELVPDHLAHFALLGRIMGLAMLHGEQLSKITDLNDFFLAFLLGRDIKSMDALAGLDPEKFKHLSKLKELDGPTLESVLQTFSVTKSRLPDYSTPHDGAGLNEEVELKVGGGNIPVTLANVDEYIDLAAKYWVSQLCDQGHPQILAAKAGLGVLLTPGLEAQMNQLFTLREVQSLLGGLPEISDTIIGDWEQHTRYEGSLSASHPLTKWFWAIVHELSPPNRAKLLAFCTGSSSAPAVGFSRLPGFNGGVTQFTLVGIDSSDEQLPSASTCFAKLRLPAYKSQDALRMKLFQAMELAEGFAEAAVVGA